LLTLGWGFFSIIGYTALPNYAIAIRISSQQASIVGAVINQGQSVGRPLIGYFSDAIGRINMCLLCTFACGVICLAMWIPATTYGVLILFASLGGIMAGKLCTTIAPVTVEVVGLPLLPSALGIFWVSLIIPSTFAEVVALELRQGRAPIYRHTQIFRGRCF
jgi:MFS family permease